MVGVQITILKTFLVFEASKGANVLLSSLLISGNLTGAKSHKDGGCSGHDPRIVIEL